LPTEVDEVKRNVPFVPILGTGETVGTVSEEPVKLVGDDCVYVALLDEGEKTESTWAPV